MSLHCKQAQRTAKGSCAASLNVDECAKFSPGKWSSQANTSSGLARSMKAVCPCSARPAQGPAKKVAVLPSVDRILLVDMGVHLIVPQKAPENLIQLGVPGLELRMIFHPALRTQKCISAGEPCQ